MFAHSDTIDTPPNKPAYFKKYETWYRNLKSKATVVPSLAKVKSCNIPHQSTLTFNEVCIHIN